MDDQHDVRLCSFDWGIFLLKLLHLRRKLVFSGPESVVAGLRILILPERKDQLVILDLSTASDGQSRLRMSRKTAYFALNFEPLLVHCDLTLQVSVSLLSSLQLLVVGSKILL